MKNLSQRLLEKLNKCNEDVRSPDLSNWIKPLEAITDRRNGTAYKSSEYYTKAKKKVQNIAKKALDKGYVDRKIGEIVKNWSEEKVNNVQSLPGQVNYYAGILLQQLKAW